MSLSKKIPPDAPARSTTSSRIAKSASCDLSGYNSGSFSQKSDTEIVFDEGKTASRPLTSSGTRRVLLKSGLGGLAFRAHACSN